tara:strand:+ start:2262 stop:2618 length:357 start_codon:yes stop_codon:yes gene_type:complete
MKSREMEHEIRPWGQFWVLEDSKTHKVKRIEVNPGGRLSYQYHTKRAEVWTIVEGKGRITLEGNTQVYKVGEVIIIPLGTKHRISNVENEKCVFIEIQYGSYFGEDDIVRIEDDYERV